MAVIPAQAGIQSVNIIRNAGKIQKQI